MAFLGLHQGPLGQLRPVQPRCGALCRVQPFRWRWELIAWHKRTNPWLTLAVYTRRRRHHIAAGAFRIDPWGNHPNGVRPFSTEIQIGWPSPANWKEAAPWTPASADGANTRKRGILAEAGARGFPYWADREESCHLPLRRPGDLIGWPTLVQSTFPRPNVESEDRGRSDCQVVFLLSAWIITDSSFLFFGREILIWLTGIAFSAVSCLLAWLPLFGQWNLPGAIWQSLIGVPKSLSKTWE